MIRKPSALTTLAAEQAGCVNQTLAALQQRRAQGDDRPELAELIEISQQFSQTAGRFVSLVAALEQQRRPG